MIIAMKKFMAFIHLFIPFCLVSTGTAQSENVYCLAPPSNPIVTRALLNINYAHGPQWVSGVHEVLHEPTGPHEIKTVNSIQHSQTYITKVRYRGKMYIAKFVDNKRDENRFIIPQAEILFSLLNDSEKLHIPKAVHFLNVSISQDREIRMILFEPLPPGKPLSKKIKNRTVFSDKEAIGIILKVAYILRELEKRGIFHWDIQPSNIWIAEDGQVFLIDFDLAFRSKEDFIQRGIAAFGPKDTRFLSLNRLQKYDDARKVQIDETYPSSRDEIYSLGATLAILLYGYGFPLNQLFVRSHHVSPVVFHILQNTIESGFSRYSSYDALITALTNAYTTVSSKAHPCAAHVQCQTCYVQSN
ncbi:MAG: protein kinase [Elusimicrobia bacterium]|nr:protein kinase [Elusimicrobiota bacterium]